MPMELHLEPLVSHRTAQTDILERITFRAIYDVYERTTCSLVAEWKFTIQKKTPVQLILYIKNGIWCCASPSTIPARRSHFVYHLYGLLASTTAGK